jgi:type 1 fimbria pilin
MLLAAGMPYASAAEYGGARDEVQGTVGWLQVSAAMRETACRLEMASTRQSISLPSVSTHQLKVPGDRSEPTAFSLRLAGCIRSAGVVMNTQNNTLAWSSQQPLVTLTFSAPANADVPALFDVMGAEGVGLRLQDAQGNTVYPGVAGAPQFLSPGGNELVFFVTAERTPAALMANAFRATLDFQLHYQ